MFLLVANCAREREGAGEGEDEEERKRERTTKREERSCANTRLLKKESNTLGAEKEKSGFRLRSFQLAWHGKGGLVARLLVRSMSSLSSSLFLRYLSRRFPLSPPFIPTSYSISSPPPSLPSPSPRSLPLSFSPPFVCCIAHTRHGVLLVNPAVIFANARLSRAARI